MTDKEDDPIVAEVRKARAQLNEEAQYDLKTLASKVAEFARNAGFKVFFFDYGLVGILLVFLFYFLAMRNAPNKRAALSACIILSLYFIVSAYMFLEKILLPMYAAAYRDDVKT